jgi:hypothetical protein
MLVQRLACEKENKRGGREGEEEESLEEESQTAHSVPDVFSS